MSDRYDRTTRSGLPLDLWTAEKWDLLHAKFPHLILTQGSPSGAAASGNTHAGRNTKPYGGGAFDLYLNGHDWKAVLRYAFEIGLFGWMRPAIAGLWKQHVHLGVRGHGRRHASLVAQELSWRAGRNGLRGNGKDFFTWRPANYKKTATYGKPAKPSKPWFSVAFLNTHGDDGATGTKTFAKRAPLFTSDVISGHPTFVAFCEVRDEQQAQLKELMLAKHYLRIAHAHRLAIYRHAGPDVRAGASSFYQYKTQNKGAVEGMLRVRCRVDGSLMQLGVTHLDYRTGFDTGRVKQMNEGWKSLRRWLVRPDWKKRTVIVGDFNSENWVMDKSLNPAGFVDAGAGATIDFIAVGSDRPVRSASKSTTKSDHPIIRASLGRY